MKRFFFSLIALSAAAIGCTQSAVLDSPDLQGKEISFSPYTGRTPLTKAQSIEGPGGAADKYGLAEDGGFNVYSFLHKPDGSTSVFMDDVNVYMQNGAWTYDEIMYWPDSKSDYKLSFAAYSENASDYVVWDEEGLGFTYTVPTEVNNQVDLLVADYQAPKASDNGGKVTLYFNHLLSRIGFKLVTTTDDESIDVVIKSVQLQGKFPVAGKVDLLSEEPAIESIDNTNAVLATSYELMDFTGDKELDGAFIVRNTKDALPIYATHVIPSEVKKDSEFQSLAEDVKTANEQSRFMMVIPHEVTDNTADRIVVSYQLTDAIQRQATIPLTNMGLTFEPCKAYEFYLSISTKSIGFHVEEHFWGENVETTNPLTPAETAIKITSAEETVKGSYATIKAHVKSEQYESIVIQSFSDDGKWRDVTNSAEYVIGQTDYTFENIAIEPNRTYSFRIAAKLLIEETPDGEGDVTEGEDDEDEDEEEQREMIYSATYIFNTAPAVVTSVDADGKSKAIITTDAGVLTGVSVTLVGEFPSINGDLELESLGFRCSLDDTTTSEGFLNGVLDDWGDGSVDPSGIKPGDTFEYDDYLFAPNTTYYYQSFAKNVKVKEITYGNVTSFTTPVITPIVTTGDYNKETVTENTVEVTAKLDSNGGDNENTRVGFHLSTDPNFTADNTKSFDYSATTIGSETTFTVKASGLIPNTVYHYRAFANNTAKNPYSASVTGETAELVTKAVATTTVLDYTSTTVTLDMPDAGVGNATTEQGFLISTLVDGLTITTTHKVVNDNCTVSGLDADTNYAVQAYVTNEVGTAYGKVLYVTTKTGDDSISDWEDDDEAPEVIG